MTNERVYELQVEMVDKDGYYRKANYGSFKLGPGPDYLVQATNFSSNDNWFVLDAFAQSENFGFAAQDTYQVHQGCVGTIGGGGGW